MSDCHKVRARGWVCATVTVVMSVAAGCSFGPNEKELALLEENKQATEAAEEQVVAKTREKNNLERQVAAKKGEHAALEQKKADTAHNLAAQASDSE